ncbi:unnamed protein product [Fusarium graminearum]|nr:unnamed protein product [Fusarium graminearum]
MSIPTTEGSAFPGLAIKNVSKSLIVGGRVNGAVHITGVSDSIIVVVARQVRIHECSNVDIYLHCGSHPIIEDCSGMRFAPTEAEEPDENQWDQVDDFKWLKAGHSPNWTTLSENERLSDDLWRSVVPGQPGVSVEEALKKLNIPRNHHGYTELEASSLAVGLPEGLMGNSEVGHLNIGAGRVVWQDVVRIDQTIKNGELSQNDVIKKTFQSAAAGNGRLHLCGLVSHGGVQTHLYALLKAAKEYGVPKVIIHFFGDGRDTDPKSGAGYMQELVDNIKEIGVGEIGTVVGRYFAMDRDKRWDRLEIALKGLILDDDTVFFFNYRSDRVRQITQLLGDVDRSPLPDFQYPKIKPLVTMTQYKVDYPFEIAFKPQHMGNVLAEWLGKQNVEQVHIAETEKYAHVTFFFNGGVEKVFPLETRDQSQDLVPSNKSVATYDLAPEMSADGVADQVVKRLGEQKFPFVMNNFAPPDMVGHTGVYDAAVIGCEATDKAIGKILEGCKKAGYVLFITADHGNAEEMKFADGKPKTSHTTNKVPLLMANYPEGWSLKKTTEGVLGDVAPTVLAAMGLPQPEEMTGKSLLEKA